MPGKSKTYLKFDHDEYAKKRQKDDFWGQIRRTINGVPVSDDQIEMITKKINNELNLSSIDTLLDLACGNGALSSLLYHSCKEYLGVDFSDYLISIAKENFEQNNKKFICASVSEYVEQERNPMAFTKALCYGSFSYFSNDDALKVIRTIYRDFKNIQTIFIGNLPDKLRANDFYKTTPSVDELTDHTSQIGIWRTKDEFKELVSGEGWNVEFSKMPTEYYASHYRYDATLVR